MVLPRICGLNKNNLYLPVVVFLTGIKNKSNLSYKSSYLCTDNIIFLKYLLRKYVCFLHFPKNILSSCYHFYIFILLIQLKINKLKHLLQNVLS